jgi:hypothetical protein
VLGNVANEKAKNDLKMTIRQIRRVGEPPIYFDCPFSVFTVQRKRTLKENLLIIFHELQELKPTSC